MRSTLCKGLFLPVMLLLLLSFACAAPEVVTSQAPKAEDISPQVPRVTAGEPWQMEWDKLLEDAKKGGRPILYTTTQQHVRQALSDGFKKRTGIELDVVTGRGAELVSKLLAERRAGLYLADVYVGGTTTLLSQVKPAGALRPMMSELFLPEVLDTKLWYKGVLPYLDKGKMIMSFRYSAGGSVMDVAFNTKLVDKRELVSWYDLLKPKFKGKMNMQDPTTAGKGGKFVNKALTYYGLDWDFMKALAKQGPFITRDQRLMIEWIVKGKHDIAIIPDHDTFRQFERSGVDYLDSVIFKETKDVLGGASGNVALIANPPHPNATKLFVNWILTKEGQTIFSRAYEYHSARVDVPTDHLSNYTIRKPDVDYPVETEEFILQEPKYRPMIQEIFGSLIQ